jgi:ABC-type multidrug transport system fused ATPase/permease subunit
VIALALSLAGSAASLATPMVTKWVLDSLGESASMVGPAGALLALLVLGAVIWTSQWFLLGTLGERVVLEARETMVRRFSAPLFPRSPVDPPASSSLGSPPTPCCCARRRPRAWWGSSTAW